MLGPVWTVEHGAAACARCLLKLGAEGVAAPVFGDRAVFKHAAVARHT